MIQGQIRNTGAKRSNGRVVVLGMGGTIAGVARQAGDNVGYDAAQLGVEQLVASVLRSASGLSADDVVAEQVAQINSKDMTHAIWLRLIQRVAHWLADASVEGIVITHGTDTLEETAYLLHRLLSPRKPVVLTCAMRPATALSADGPQNLADALTLVRWPLASGVMTVASATVHGAHDVQKVHPYRVDAFSSADAGPIARIEESRVVRLRDWPSSDAPPLWQSLHGVMANTDEWPWVEIITGHGGMDPRVVDALVQAGVQGLVVAGSGNGSVHEVLMPTLARARAAGVRVWRGTRCLQGRVVPAVGSERTEAWDAVTDLPPVKARIGLMLELMAERRG